MFRRYNERELIPDQTAAGILQDSGFTIVTDHIGPGFFTVAIADTAEIFNSIEILNALETILFAEPDFLTVDCGVAVDADYSTEQWYLDNSSGPDIGIEGAWAYNKCDADVWLAPLERGFNYSHPELAGQYLTQYDYDFAHDVSDSQPDTGAYAHPTEICGLLVAKHGNETGAHGIKGIAPDCRILPVGTDNNGDVGKLKDCFALLITSKAAAISYVDSLTNAHNKRTIISMSWSRLEGDYETIEFKINSAYQGGDVLLVSASANDGSGTVSSYPARYANVIGVGATDSDDSRAYFSNYGISSGIELAAPGAGVYTTSGDSGYATVSGTSYSAPIVAAVAALVWAEKPTWDNSDVRDVLVASAEKVGGYTYTNDWSAELGYGRINANIALAAATNGTPSAPVQLGPRGIQTVIGYGGYRKPKIRWTSAGEADLAGFEIERSEDGDPFAPLWNVTIGPTVRSHIDQEVNVDGPGDVTVTYRLRAFDVLDNYSPYSNTKSIQVGGFIAKSLADGAEGVSIPKEYALSGAYPNPFNPSTTLRYGLPEASQLSLRIYNITGREITSWYIDQSAGYHSITWPGTNRSGLAVPSGLYFYVLEAKSAISDSRFTDTGKMLLLK